MTRIYNVKPGQRLSADTMNALIDSHNEYIERPDDLSAKNGAHDLWGICDETVPVFSLLHVLSTASGVTSPESPVVKVAKPSTRRPLGLFTNGAVSGTKIPLQPLQEGQPIKLDVVTTDTFVIGGRCGPKNSSFQCSSSGYGLVCLSAPVTYQSTRKYIWAAMSNNPAEPVHFKVDAGGDIPAFNAGTLTMSSASAQIYISSSSGLLVADTTENVYNPFLQVIKANSWGLGLRNAAGIVVAVSPYQFDVRVKPDYTALQKSYDGGVTWEDWCDIGECDP